MARDKKIKVDIKAEQILKVDNALEASIKLNGFDTLQKLNEQLSAENISLLQKIDELNEEVENEKLAYNLMADLFHIHKDELRFIKSKWWYKLFKNI